jgi:hypothetical protein
MVDFIQKLTLYNQEQEANAEAKINDLVPGLKHHSLHCISLAVHFPVLINMDWKQFGRLFESMKPVLQRFFPRCPESLGEHETSQYCSRRMRLFLCLSSSTNMEVIFGWSASTIERSIKLILQFLKNPLINYQRKALKKSLGYLL